MDIATLTNHPFWRFSIDAWKHQSIEEKCLLLQNKYNLNTNFILFGCWLAKAHQSTLNVASVHQLLTLVTPWHEEVVVTLRAVRENTKAQVLPNALAPIKLTVKKKINEAELLGEAVEQYLLYQSINTLSLTATENKPSVTLANENMQAYLRAAHITLSEEDQASLDTLLSLIIKTTG